MPDLHATVAEVSVSQDDLTDHSLQPDASVHPDLENGPALLSTLEQGDIPETVQSGNLAIPATSSLSITLTHTATTPGDGTTHVLTTEEAQNAELQSTQNESINADEASTRGLDKPQLMNPLCIQSAIGLDGDDTRLQNDYSLVGPDFRTPSPWGFSPALSYVDEEVVDPPIELSEMLLGGNVPNHPHVRPEQDRLSITSRHSSPATVPPLQLIPDSVDGSQLENLLAPESFDRPLDDPALIEEALEPPCLSPNEPVAAFTASLSSLDGSLLSLPPSLEFLFVPDLKPYNAVGDKCLDVNDVALNDQKYETTQSSSTSEESLGSKDLRESIRSSPSSPQPSPASSTSHPDSEPTTVSLLTRSQSVDIRSVTSSADETFEDPIVDSEVSSTQSPSWPSTPVQPNLQCLPDTDDCNVDMNISVNPNFGSAFILPVDIIPVTPPGSPIFEGLSRYMVSHGSEVSFRVGQDNASTPFQHDISSGERTLWRPSEAPRFGLLSSNGNGQSLRSGFSQSLNSPESSESDVDIATQPCPHHLSHDQVRDSYLGMPTSPLERIQLGFLRAIPAMFALDRETINRIA